MKLVCVHLKTHCNQFLTYLGLLPFPRRQPSMVHSGKGVGGSHPHRQIYKFCPLVHSLTSTVYTLWKKPDLLPFLSTPSAVIPVLIGGADLMVPGGSCIPASASRASYLSLTSRSAPYSSLDRSVGFRDAVPSTSRWQTSNRTSAGSRPHGCIS
jgi:hypothetical protein